MGNKYDEQTAPSEVSVLQRATNNSESAPFLIVLNGPSMGSLFALSEVKTSLGRSNQCHIQIDDESLSREHLTLTRLTNNDYLVRDLGSTNGTYHNGERIDHVILRDNERFQAGATLLQRISLAPDIEASFRRLYDASVRDALTGLHNRRYLEERLEAEISFACRHQRPVSVIIFDIDHFKQVNDRYGHQAGDQVLRQIGEILQRSVRAEDVVARYGGEEFVVLAPGIDGDQAESLAERVRNKVRDMIIPWRGDELLVTISAGVTTALPTDDSACSDIVSSADEALYEAKRSGRDRIIRAAP